MKRTSKYKRFSGIMKGLLSVSHREIKTKLDAERKARKRKKAGQSSASREAGGQR